MKYFLLIITFLLFSCSKNNIVSDNQNVWKVQEKQVILALWDSLTAWNWVDENQNYPSKLQEKLDENWYNYEVINAWVSWDTSQNLKSRVWLYLDKKPKIVILVIWWNDWLRGLGVTDLKNNILDIINTFKESKIVLWWMDLPLNLWPKYREEFKNVYIEIAKERPDIYFLKYFLEWVGWNPDLNNEDMIHPNSKWYDIIIKNLFDFMEKNKVVSKN